MKKTICVPMRVAGFYKLEAIRPDGSKRLLADWFPNLITNVGLNAIGTSGQWLQQCRVGSGSTAPNVADTSLDAQIAASTTVQASVTDGQPSAPYYGSVTNTYRFATGVAAGNLAEVGIGITASTLFSRALILDGVGDPTTITVQVDEVLDVTYQLRVYPPETDVEDTITISGDDYDYTLRAALVTNDGSWSVSEAGHIGGGFQCVAYDGAIGTVEQNPSGTTSVGVVTNDAYGNNNLYRGFTAVWGLDVANFGGGIMSVGASLGGGGRLGAIQIEFDPPIPKDNTQVLTLGLRHVWARKTL